MQVQTTVTPTTRTMATAIMDMDQIMDMDHMRPPTGLRMRDGLHSGQPHGPHSGRPDMGPPGAA